jgi:hypothetical protein
MRRAKASNLDRFSQKVGFFGRTREGEFRSAHPYGLKEGIFSKILLLVLGNTAMAMGALNSGLRDHTSIPPGFQNWSSRVR